MTRTAAVTATSLTTVAGLGVLSVSVGTFPVSVSDVIRAFAGDAPADVAFVVRELRLPRAVVGAFVGAAFGMCGAVFQTVARNPLASPDVIGITAGASAAAVLVIVTADASQPIVLAAAAVIGALGTAAAIGALAWRRGRRVTPYQLVLVGIGVTAALSSVISFLLTRADVYDIQRVVVWLTGSLNARTWDHAAVVAPAALVIVPLLAAGRRPLRVLELGDDLAAGLGVRVGAVRAVTLAGAVVLAAAATAAAGPIAFVALAAPQIARRAARAGEPVLLASAACGAALVLAADLAARTTFAPIELPVGVVTAVLGGPYLLWLLARTHRRETP